MLFISACFSEYELIVKNNSSGDAWICIDGGDDRFIPAMTTRSFSVSGPYTIALHYQGVHIWPGVISVDLSQGGGQSITLEPSCGALRLSNRSSGSIRSVWITASGNGYWGANILDGNLPAGASHTISLDPGNWDLKIQDQHYNYYYYPGLSVQLDQTRVVSFNR